MAAMTEIEAYYNKFNEEKRKEYKEPAGILSLEYRRK